ncbi:hypothetical protein BV22DRAFT_1192237 [Leucogyrophana mollusca]|uniref:Uncharacterized protein n=1 Tax=Leucogyrophana mollusca TaxID=85980 RepID=A0ACB8BT63_9AGAM|nr:hypothetical protein BV22DRAFT_1192237 [Leucogyrophana mollusca]
MTILVYDYILTFDLELTHILGQPWGMVKGIYLFTKYMPFIDTTTLILYSGILPGPSERACHIAMGFVAYMYPFCMFVAEIIILVRTWAIWGRGRKLGVVLAVLTVAIFIVGCYFTAISVRALASSAASRSMLGGCFDTTPRLGPSDMDVVVWSLFMVQGSLYLIMLIIHACLHFRQRCGMPASSLYKLLLRDGITYYAILLSLSAVNIAITATANQTGFHSISLAAPTRVLHAVLATRIVLRIRETATQD